MTKRGEYDFEAELRLFGSEVPEADADPPAEIECDMVLGPGKAATGVLRDSGGGLRAPGSPVEVELHEAALHPRSLWEGRELELRRRGVACGSVRVVRVRRALLDRDSKAVLPMDEAAAAVCGMVGALRSDGGGFAERLAHYRLGASLRRIGTLELMAQLAARPDWVDEWYAWADGNRLRAGPFLFRYQSGGWAGYYECSGVALESLRFEDSARACAAFLLLEIEDSGLCEDCTLP